MFAVCLLYVCSIGNLEDTHDLEYSIALTYGGQRSQSTESLDVCASAPDKQTLDRISRFACVAQIWSLTT
jgi:hypothetical protein